MAVVAALDETKVRSVVPEDVPAIVRLLNEVDEFYGDVVTESPDERSSSVARALFGSPPLAYALLAVADDGRAVGFAAYSMLWPAAGSTASLFLKELFVTEPARRGGVGRRLFAELCRIALRLGLSRVELTTDRSNRDAQDFYRRLGLPSDDGKVLYRLGGDQVEKLAGA